MYSLQAIVLTLCVLSAIKFYSESKMAVDTLNRSMKPFSLEFTKLVTHLTSDTENTSVATTASFSNTEETSGSSVWGQGKQLHDYFVHNIFCYFILVICSVGTSNNIIVMLTMLMSAKLIKDSGGMFIMALAFCGLFS